MAPAIPTDYVVIADSVVTLGVEIGIFFSCLVA
jgi:hypothetical protein